MMENTAEDTGSQEGLEDSEGVRALGRAAMFQRDENKNTNTSRMVKCEAGEGLGCDTGEGGVRQSPTGHCPKQAALLAQDLTQRAQGRIAASHREKVLACGTTLQAREKINE